MKPPRACFWMVGLAALLAACSSTSNTPDGKKPIKTQAAAIHPPASVIVFDDILAEKIFIRTQDSRRDSSGVFIARTVLKNESTSSVHVRVQTFFKNEKGVTVDRGPEKELFFEPLAEKTCVEKSIQPNISRFIVYLRPVTEESAQIADSLVLDVDDLSE